MIEHHHAMGEIHHHSHVVLDQRNGRAVMIVHVDDETRHVLLLFEVHACHRLIEEKKGGLHLKGAAAFAAPPPPLCPTHTPHPPCPLNSVKNNHLPPPPH